MVYRNKVGILLDSARKMFEELSEKFQQAFRSVSGVSRITDVNIAETMREIRRALLEADVNYDVARDFTQAVRDEFMGASVVNTVSPGQQFTKIVYDRLVETLGAAEPLKMAQTPPTVILIAGLQGSGKTTFTAKLAAFLKEKKRTPLIAAADVYRPAAVDQLKTLASQINVPVYSIEEKDAVRVAREALAHARKTACDTLIVDTAGRLHVDEEMMQEVATIKQLLKPTEILFVVDAMTGQDAVNTAREFNERLNFDGVVLTKMDGDTRGGAALSIRTVVKKPIKFLSTGEKIDALTEFFPERLAKRILGMGDVVSLVEKAQAQFDEEKAKKLQKKIRTQTFDLEDFLEQLHQVKKMGSLTDLVGMIPGMGQAMKGMQIKDDAFKPVEAMIQSMTFEERRNPDRIDASRKKRIASGSGTTVRDINELLKQFEQMKKMMKAMSGMSKFGQMVQGVKQNTFGRR